MRKTSQDGGDTSSITSGMENETKKSGAGIIKTTRNSIKRKVQNFSHESDDAVIEPLLQKDKEKMEIINQSAKYLLSKAKTDLTCEKGHDKDKLLFDNKMEKPISNVQGIAESSLLNNNLKENQIFKSYSNTTAPIHNHMNTNVFSTHDGLKVIVSSKSQILVEVDGSKHTGYNPSPLIFTTAKIHTDGKTKHMEPVQVTPVPILSTIEGGIVKAGSVTDSEKKFSELSGKSNDGLSVVQTKIGKRDAKMLDKAPLFTATSGNICQSGILSKDRTPKFPEGIKVQNEVSKISSVENFTQTQSAFVTNTDVTKINLDTKNLNSDLKRSPDKLSISISQSQSTYSSISDNIQAHNSNKALKQKLVKTEKPLNPLIATSLKKHDNKDEQIVTTKVCVEKDKLNIFVSKENETDMNKIIQNVDNTNLNKAKSDKINLSVDKDTASIVSNNDSFSKIISTSTNKQLQRQKNATIEDIGELDVSAKIFNDDKSAIMSVVAKDSNGKSTTLSKGATQSYNASVTNKEFDKPSLQNSTVTHINVCAVTTKPASKITATVTGDSTIISKFSAPKSTSLTNQTTPETPTIAKMKTLITEDKISCTTSSIPISANSSMASSVSVPKSICVTKSIQTNAATCITTTATNIAKQKTEISTKQPSGISAVPTGVKQQTSVNKTSSPIAVSTIITTSKAFSDSTIQSPTNSAQLGMSVKSPLISVVKSTNANTKSQVTTIGKTAIIPKTSSSVGSVKSLGTSSVKPPSTNIVSSSSTESKSTLLNNQSNSKSSVLNKDGKSFKT